HRSGALWQGLPTLPPGRPKVSRDGRGWLGEGDLRSGPGRGQETRAQRGVCAKQLLGALAWAEKALWLSRETLADRQTFTALTLTRPAPVVPVSYQPRAEPEPGPLGHWVGQRTTGDPIGAEPRSEPRTIASIVTRI